MSCFYNTRGNLIIKAAVDFDEREFLFPETKKDDYCQYKEEEFQGPEMVDKENIFNLFNFKLKSYIEKLKNNNK